MDTAATGPPGGTPEVTTEATVEVVDQLRAEVAELRRQVEQLRVVAAVDPQPTAPAAAPANGPVSRRGVLLGLAGAAGAVGAVGASLVTATPAGAAPLDDGTSDLGDRNVEWTSTHPVATLQLRNRGTGSGLIVSATSGSVPGVRLEQTNADQTSLAVRHNGRGGTSPALDVLSSNGGNALSARGRVVGVFGVGELYGVEGQSFAAGGIGVAAGGRKAALRLRPDGQPPSERTATTYVGGEVLIDAELVVWVCVEGGTPGTWRRVVGPTAAGVLHVIDPPQRVFDSRQQLNQPLAANAEQPLPLGDDVPTGSFGARAVLLTLTSTLSSGRGYLSVFSSGRPWPGTTSLSFSGQDATTLALSAMGDTGVTIRVGGDPGTTTHVAVDVLGWWG